MKKPLGKDQLIAIHAQGVWSRKCKFSPEMIKLLKNNAGIYEMFDKHGNRIYVGVAHRIKHRVESYREKDDFMPVEGHPTKEELRPLIKQFRVKYIPIEEARKHEEIIKQQLPFNMDSHEHELEKKKNAV